MNLPNHSARKNFLDNLFSHDSAILDDFSDLVSMEVLLVYNLLGNSAIFDDFSDLVSMEVLLVNNLLNNSSILCELCNIIAMKILLLDLFTDDVTIRPVLLYRLAVDSF